jgi:hypothetical protein
MSSLRKKRPCSFQGSALIAPLLLRLIGLQGVVGGVNRFNTNSDPDPYPEAEPRGLSQTDEERLARIYGKEAVVNHRRDFLDVGQREVRRGQGPSVISQS